MRRKFKWARWNNKLDKYSLYIDLANIRTLSTRALATGYISPKVINKWRRRSRLESGMGSCYKKHEKCAWLPMSIFKYKYDNLGMSTKFWWCCRKCRTITTTIEDSELSGPMLSAYKQYTIPAINKE